MSEEIHAKLLPFLSSAFDRKDHRQAVRVDLLHSQPNTRDVELRRWDRKSPAEAPIFESLELTERLIREIIEAAENHADGFGFGSHRFVVRVHEHMGGKSVESFRIKPSYQDQGGDGHALTTSSSSSMGGEALGVMTQHAGMLMRTNQQMFDSSFRTLAVLTENVTDEVKELRRENAELRRKLDAAESTRDDREFQYGMAAEANARKSKTAEKILQIGTAVAAKFTGAPEIGGPSGAQMLIADLRASLRPEQIAAIMRVLDQGQMIQFGMLMEMIPMGAQGGQGGGNPGAAAAGG